MNENHPNSFHSKGSGVTIPDMVTQTATTTVFLKKFGDDIALIFVEDGQGLRHPVDGDNVLTSLTS